MYCIGFDKQWALHVDYFGVRFHWLGEFGLFCKFVLLILNVHLKVVYLYIPYDIALPDALFFLEFSYSLMM